MTKKEKLIFAITCAVVQSDIDSRKAEVRNPRLYVTNFLLPELEENGLTITLNEKPKRG